MKTTMIILSIVFVGCVSHQDLDAICEVYCENYQEESCPSHLSRDNCEQSCRSYRSTQREAYPDCYAELEQVYECMSERSCHEIESCWPYRQAYMDCYIPMAQDSVEIP